MQQTKEASTIFSDFKEKVEIDLSSVYSEVIDTLDGGALVNAREVFRSIFRAVGISQQEVAAMAGWSKQSLNTKLINDSLKLDEALAIMDKLGVDLVCIGTSGEEHILKEKDRGTLKLADAVKLLDDTGTRFLFRVQESGKEIEIKARRRGPAVRGMIDGKWGSTSALSSVANSLSQDEDDTYGPTGVAEELFRSSAGRWYIATYYADHTRKNQLREAERSEVDAFLKEHRPK